MNRKHLLILACLASLTSCDKIGLSSSHSKSFSAHSAHAKVADVPGSAYENSFNAALMSTYLCDAGDGYRESQETAETSEVDATDPEWHDHLGNGEE